MRLFPLLLAAVGGALGASLDRGLALLLPTAPWPDPLLTGWGAPLGGALGALSGFALHLSATRGALAPPPPGALARAAAGGLCFTLAVTAMVGAIGYASGRRSATEREVVRLREVRKEIDKKLVDPQKGAAEVALLEARLRRAHDPARAALATRQAAGGGALVGGFVAAAFACMAVVYRRALATRPPAPDPAG